MQLPFEITGTITHGKKRGKLLGYPTANIKLNNLDINKLDSGVYKSTIILLDKSYIAATSIGLVSTFDQKIPSIEVHILNFNQNIYGMKVVLTLLEKIRNMQKFESVEALVKQIKLDVDRVSLI